MKSIKLMTAGISFSTIAGVVLYAAIAVAASCGVGEKLRGCSTVTNPDGSTYCQCTDIDGAGHN